MRVVIDLQSVETGSRYRGIGQYSVSLVREMLKQRGEHEVLLLLSDYCEDAIEFVLDQFKGLIELSQVRVFHGLDGMVETADENPFQIQVSEALRADLLAQLAPDLVLVSSLFEGAREEFVCSIEKDAGFLTAVIGYDLIPLTAPKKYLGDERIESWYFRKIESLRNADLIFAISESARSEFQEHLQLSDDRVKTISTACSGDYRRKTWNGAEQDILGPLGIKDPYILYSGAADERKNLHGLLRAFASLDESLKQKYQIVLVGKYIEHERAALLALGKKLGLAEQDLIFTNFISNETLCCLYNNCELFVFPSFHEGFGLPVLEAISCGAPTICSNTSSLPEVLAFPEAMFDPSNDLDIARCMHKALTDDDFRERLVAHGLKKATEFSWEEVAGRTWEFIEKACVDRQSFFPETAIIDPSKARQKLRSLLQKEEASESLKRCVAHCLAANERELTEKVKSQEKRIWRLEGPFDSSYSLALLNRETARALKRLDQEVVLHSTEGLGNYEPDLAYLKQHPDIEELYQSRNEKDDAAVVTRNLYPPRVSEMPAEIRMFHHYAWEEAGFPREWAEKFNQELSGLTTLSEHVRKVMIDNGVALPVPVSGCGVDHWERVTSGDYKVTAKSFRFLHVSSCFPRKGVDSLLEAYGQVFSASDDVSLIIKTFDNPHNDVRERIAEHQRLNQQYPDVQLIFEDLSEADLKALYEQCHALVAPSKAEGFGLPMAEAMLSGLPVITTAWGGQLDFCTPNTAWLVDYRFAPAESHFNLPLSVWAEPFVKDLSEKMREVYESSHAERSRRVNNARRLLEKRFSWDQVASRLIDSASRFGKSKKSSQLKVGWVSTWKEKCGIATYSEHLIKENAKHDVVVFAPRNSNVVGEDESSVIRCWELNDQDPLRDLYFAVKSAEIDVLIIQMNINFYDYQALTRFVRGVKSLGITVSLTLHSTVCVEERKSLLNLRPCLDLVDRIIVHSIDDLNRLKLAGAVSNAMVLPHGIVTTQPDASARPAAKTPKTIASYGFALPHKGIEELIDAFVAIEQERRDVRLLLLNAEHAAPVSGDFIARVEAKIAGLTCSDKITFVNEFLDDQECLNRLAQADVIAMPYQDTGESSSGAVKMAIASRSPVIVTPLGIFDDVTGAVDFFNGRDAGAIKEGVKRILDGGRRRLPEDVENWCASHSYSVISRRLFDMTESLVINS